MVYTKKWKPYALIACLSMLVDADHLLANPIFDPNRCSIGFHPLHSYWAIVVYGILFLFLKDKWKWLFFCLLFHMLTDAFDWWMKCQAGLVAV